MTTPDVSCRMISQLVAEAFNIPDRALYSRRRTKTLITARRMAWLLACNWTRRSYPEIGRYMGGFDHSSVHEGCALMARQLKIDCDSATAFGLLEAAVETLSENMPGQLEDRAEAVVHEWQRLRPEVRSSLGATFTQALSHLGNTLERI